MNTVAAAKATTPAVINPILPILLHKLDDFFLNLKVYLDKNPSEM